MSAPTAADVFRAIAEYVAEAIKEAKKPKVDINYVGMFATTAFDDQEDEVVNFEPLDSKREHAIILLDAFVEAKAEQKLAELVEEMQGRKKQATKPAGYHPLYDGE